MIKNISIRYSILSAILLIDSLLITAQTFSGSIEGQIIGYKGNGTLNYTLKEFYGGSYNASTPIDSLGNFRINVQNNKIQFFVLYYRQDSILHTCRLVVEPGTKYYFISRGSNAEDWKTNYSPIIFRSNKMDDFNFANFKVDKASMFYNLIDNGTFGHLYHHEWNLNKPDSLIQSLEYKINNGLQTLNQLSEAGEISKEFFQIAKLNLEYTQAYRLAQTISDVWFSKKYLNNDSTNLKKLISIYPKIFEKYPVNKTIPLDKHFCFGRYVDLYIDYLSNCNNGVFYPQKQKADRYLDYITKAEPYLNSNAYCGYRLDKSMSSLVALSPNSVTVAKKILNEQPNFGPKATFYINQVLIPKAEAFENLANLNFPSDVIVLDKIAPINSFKELVEIVGNNPFIIDFWGTWCPPCRYQISYQEAIDSLLEKYNIKKVFIAVQYGIPRVTWENFLKSGKMKGYHFISNQEFIDDFTRVVLPVDKFPKYILFNKHGELIDSDLPYPSDKNELTLRIEKHFNK